MAVATNGAAAASPCLRHAHLLGLLIEAHPVEKFLWAKFKMQGDIMILLSDITLQVKVKLPYTDMMILQGRLTFKPKMLPSSIKTQLPSLWWNTLDVTLQGEIRPQSQSLLCLKAYRLFPSCLHPGKTMFNLIRTFWHFVELLNATSDGEIRPQIQLSLCPQTCANPQLFTAQIHPNKTMFNLVR
uniref:Uncharacterized protein n=1 Tax=Oryza glumipatula TaxID=40148 RepID=A0A0D9YPX6_9ORYZ